MWKDVLRVLYVLIIVFYIRRISSDIQRGQYDLTRSSFLFNQDLKTKVSDKRLLYTYV